MVNDWLINRHAVNYSIAIILIHFTGEGPCPILRDAPFHLAPQDEGTRVSRRRGESELSLDIPSGALT